MTKPDDAMAAERRASYEIMGALSLHERRGELAPLPRPAAGPGTGLRRPPGAPGGRGGGVALRGGARRPPRLSRLMWLTGTLGMGTLPKREGRWEEAAGGKDDEGRAVVTAAGRRRPGAAAAAAALGRLP